MAAGPLRRLAASGLAYQSPSLISGVLALVTLRLYTDYLSKTELGWAEVLLALIIFVSILVRAGLQEALLRHWFLDEDLARRGALARRVFGSVLLVTSSVAALAVLFAAQLSGPLLNADEPGLIRAAAFGLWAFANLEVANALLRAQEARKAYLIASLSNVFLTVAGTITLVVALKQGPTGYLLGNYIASFAVLIGVWWSQRSLLTQGSADVALKPLLKFGLPTVPADAAVFALNLIDRQWLVQTGSRGDADLAGIYAFAVKLATVVIVLARAFQSAWPPLAYDLSDEEAPKVYAQVVRLYIVGLGWVVTSLALLSTQVTRLLAGSKWQDSIGEIAQALPWLALGWALWGLTWVFNSIAGRVQKTTRTLLPALVGLAVNVAALSIFVPKYGATGAAIALVAAYLALLAVSFHRTRKLMPISFEFARIGGAIVVLLVIAVGLGGVLPNSGLEGWLTRLAASALGLGLLLAIKAVKRAEISGFAGPLDWDEISALPWITAHERKEAQNQTTTFWTPAS